MNTPDTYILSQEKRTLVDQILTTVANTQKNEGQEKTDMFVMQIMDFLSSEKKPVEFELEYLKGIADKVQRHATLMRKIRENKTRIKEAQLDKLMRMKQEEAERKKSISDKIHQDIRDEQQKETQIHANIAYYTREVTEQQKVLYNLLENMCSNTLNPTLRSRDLGSIAAYARIIMMPSMEDGLPLKVPQTFVKYFSKYGLGDTKKQLTEVFELVEKIKKGISEQEIVIAKNPIKEDERVPSMSDSGRVFTDSFIPVPINRLATRGIKGYSTRARREEMQITEE